MIKWIVVSVVCFLFPAVQTWGGTLRMPEYYADGMVIQRGKVIRIEGQAIAGTQVKIVFSQYVREVKADVTGNWAVCFEQMKAGGPYELRVSSSGDTLRFSDVLVGDVWFAAGQSNMAFRLKTMTKKDFEKEKSEADCPKIRYYGTAGVVSGGKLVESPDRKWAGPQPDGISEWSAIAYLFAREIYQRYRIPIGIVCCAQGSSTAEAWLSPRAYEEDPELAGTSGKEYTGIQALYRNPSVLYRNMLSKFRGMTIKGIIWYQGESNAYDPAEYRTVFSALIRDWRAFFKTPDLPFIYAQLPAYRMPGDRSEQKWAEMRQVQLEVAQSTANTALVVTSDYGEAGNIHPKDKRPVARRFALAAEGLAYGGKSVYQLQIPEKADKTGNKVRIVFPDKKIHLVVKGQMQIEVCGKDGRFYPAEYSLQKGSLTVWADPVADPVKVRYAYANVNQLALYDRSGIPVSPFTLEVAE